MKLKNAPIEVSNHFHGQMLRFKDLMEHKVNTRIDKFQVGPDERTDDETKTKIIIEMDKCFEEVFDSITIN